MVRNPATADDLRAAGAEVVAGDLNDAASVTAAMHGVTGAYIMLPHPPNNGTDLWALRRRQIAGLVDAVRSSGSVRHVVTLSSMGAQHESGTGPIAWLHALEKAFDALVSEGISVTHVRAAYFMENLNDMMGAVLGNSVLPSFIRAEDVAFPMIAAADIGAFAARALVDSVAAGGARRRVVELEGPARYCPRDSAAILSRLLDKTVTLVTQPEAALEAMLVSFGYSAEFAGMIREMVEAMNEGRLALEGCEHAKTETPLETVLAASVHAAMAAHAQAQSQAHAAAPAAEAVPEATADTHTAAVPAAETETVAAAEHHTAEHKHEETAEVSVESTPAHEASAETAAPWYVVFGASGRTGKACVHTLLEHKQKVRYPWGFYGVEM